MPEDRSESLDLHRRLRLADHLELVVLPRGEVVVDPAGAAIPVPPPGLAVLAAFVEPITFGDALEVIGSSAISARDWMELTSTVIGLVRAGVLVDPDVAAPSTKGEGFEAPSIHVAMLDDVARTGAYLAAVREVVTADDVVLDIGTGTGVLAAAAAAHGARHVYAIEAGGAAAWARAGFAANGFDGRVTLVEGWSHQVDLPERADVLVAEVLGHEPLAERILETTIDARRRLLTPAARLIPGRLRIWAAPVAVPAEVRAKEAFTPAAVARWEAAYGLDFSALVDVAAVTPVTFVAHGVNVAQWRHGTAVVLADIDLATVAGAVVDASLVTVATEELEADGVVVWFDVELSPGRWLTTDPWQVGEANHWRYAVWAYPTPLSLRPGDAARIDYRYGVSGLPPHERVTLAPG